MDALIMARRGPPPSQFTAKLLVGLTDEHIAAIDAWRRKQDDPPTRTEAARMIIEQHLGLAPKSKPAKRKG
jgi:hypothetical protein